MCLAAFMLVAFFNSDKPENLIPFLGLLTFIIYRSQPVIVGLVQGLSSIQLVKKQITNGIEILSLSFKYNDQEKKELDTRDLPISENSFLEIKNLQFSYNEKLTASKKPKESDELTIQYVLLDIKKWFYNNDNKVKSFFKENKKLNNKN